MLTRREALFLLASAPAAARLALIETFRQQSDGLEKKYERRTHKSDWTMPYRLFRPEGKGKLPLVMYLHGSGGLGDDNDKQLGFGNIFGTRVWLLPENQKQFPCFVVVPQTDRGWMHYEADKDNAGVPAPGFGEGNKLALEIIDELRREFPIDENRIYVTGQSMGGGGVWNLLKHGPQNFFAAALPVCGAKSPDDGTGSPKTAVWAFHGEADKTVPVSVTRDRIAARKKAGGSPRYTEYAGVDHNSWEWAYTEPELVRWTFAQKRRLPSSRA
ncbi:MAG TPA: phospholipase [Thermoanaerobaculia bacterium]